MGFDDDFNLVDFDELGVEDLQAELDNFFIDILYIMDMNYILARETQHSSVQLCAVGHFFPLYEQHLVTSSNIKLLFNNLGQFEAGKSARNLQHPRWPIRSPDCYFY